MPTSGPIIRAIGTRTVRSAGMNSSPTLIAVASHHPAA